MNNSNWKPKQNDPNVINNPWTEFKDDTTVPESSPKDQEVLDRYIQPETSQYVDSCATRIPTEHEISNTFSQTRVISGLPRFQSLRKLASGGLGEVSVALDTELNREVAYKQILDRHVDDPLCRERFLLEAEITGNLEHPGIVPIYGVGTDEVGRPYYAMRLIDGESFEHAIDDFHRTATWTNGELGQQSLNFRRLIQRFIDVCNAVRYAHSRGVVHRDLKPANVMVGRHGETLVVDWGLAKPINQLQGELCEDTSFTQSRKGQTDLTQQGSLVGTPAYMSPEQAAGRHKDVGPASDIYSLGATLYYLLTGRPPFGNHTLREILKNVENGNFPPPCRIISVVPAALNSICLKAMALRTTDRYASLAELTKDLENWLADVPVSAYREPIWQWMSRLTRRHHAWFQAILAFSLAFSLVSLVAIILILLARSDREAAYKREAVARAQAQQNARIANLQVGRLLFEQAFNDFLVGSKARGWLRLAYSLRKAVESKDGELEQLIRLDMGARLTSAQTPRGSFSLGSATRSITFSWDGKRVAAAAANGLIRQFSLSGEIFPDILIEHPSQVNALTYSSDSRHLFMGMADGAILVADCHTGNFSKTPINYGKPIVALAYGPDNLLVALDENWDLYRCYPDDWKLSGSVLSLANPKIEDSTLSNQARFTFNSIDFFVRVKQNNNLLIRDSIFPGIFDPFDNEEVELVKATFDPTSNIVATRSVKGLVQLWKVESMIDEKMINKHTFKYKPSDGGIWRPLRDNPNPRSLSEYCLRPPTFE